MQLAEWLDTHGVTRSEFARRAAISLPYLSQLCTGRRSVGPSLAVAQRIMRATCGAVRPEDWFRDNQQCTPD